MADRSVVVRLLANVTDFKASMQAAEKATADLGRDLGRLDGRTVTANVRVDDGGSTARAAAGVNGLISAALAVSPAFGAIGATAAAGIGAIAPLAVTAAGGLGVLALGFSGVGDAVGLLADQQQATGAALDTINQKLAQVNPSTLEFARYVQSNLVPALKGLRETAASGLLPGVREGLDALLPYLPRLEDLVGRLSQRFGDLAAEGASALTNPVWTTFFEQIDRNAVPIMDDLFRTLGNVATGFAGVTTAFMPMARDLSGGILTLSRDFAEWGAQLAESPGFRTFESYVREQWPKVQQIVGNLAETIGALLEAGAPLGSAYLDAFVLFTDVLAGLPVGVVQALLTAFLGYKAVTGVADLINGVAASFGRLQTAAGQIGLGHFAGVRDGVAGVGTAAGSATGKIDTFAAGMGRLTAAAGGAAAAATGVMLLGTAVSSLDSALAPTPLTMEAATAALLGLEGGIASIDAAAANIGQNSLSEIDSFGEAIKRISDPGIQAQLNDFGADLFNVVTLGAGPGDLGEGAASRRRSLEFLGGLDGALAQLVGSGNADLAAEKFRALTVEAERNGVSVEQLRALFPEYQASLQGLANEQGIAAQAVGGTATALQNQYAVVDQGPSHFEAMVGAVDQQLSIYQTLLQEKTTKEQETARATADSTASTTDSWRDHVGNVGVSLQEYAARLDEDVRKKDEWRANIKAVTERGGVEVGAALLAMGEEGARIADDMANATDADFRRMADAMTNHARNGGARAVWEMDQAMKIMSEVSASGGRIAAQELADKLRIGVADVARIAANYGIKLGEGINPVLVALGKQRIQYGQLATGSNGSAYAQGGIEDHTAQIAPAGAWRVWAEPETGGEAYIPLAPGKRTRSLNIWRETGRRLGAPEAEYFAFGGISDVPRPYSTAPYRLPISTGGDATMQRMYEEIAAVMAEKARRDAEEAAASARGPSTPNGVGGLGPAAARAHQFVRSNWGFRGTIGGYANRNIAGTNVKSKHALGKAIDVMTYSNMALGQSIADFFAGPGRGRFGVDNVIWNRRIHSGRGWSAYRGVSPHTDHPHIDFYRKGGLLNPHVRDAGGPLLPGYTYNGTGGLETVVPNRHMVDARSLAPTVIVAPSAGGGRGPLIGEYNQTVVASDPAAAFDVLDRSLRIADLGGRYAWATV